MLDKYLENLSRTIKHDINEVEELLLLAKGQLTDGALSDEEEVVAIDDMNGKEYEIYLLIKRALNKIKIITH